MRLSGVTVLVCAVLVASCTPSPATNAPTSPPAKSAHVFVIVMENQSFKDAMTGAFTASLADRYGVATNYHAIGYPSVPNHLALTSGKTWGVTDDSFQQLPEAGIDSQLESKGLSWRGYFEGYSGDCLQPTSQYVPRHNPFAYYGGDCPASVVSTEHLAGDLTGGTPDLVWIVPGLCHSTHDCPVATGDRWLAQIVPQITTSQAWNRNGALFIVWDEDHYAADNQVAALVVTPTIHGRRSDVPYDHYSLLATVEELLGLPRLGRAKEAKSMSDLVPVLPN